jgi:hypothetical protein
MDVSAIVARLSAECPSIAQVITATTGGTLSPVASQATLYTLLSGLVGNRMYPLQLPESVTHPSIVYQMVSSTPGVFEGYDVTHTDIFILNVRGADYDALLTLVGSIVSALAGETIEITDMLHDFDQSENLYRINLEISYSYITSASQALPAVFVYPVSRSGADSAFDNYTKQLISEDFAFLVVTDGGDIPALLDEIQAALLGWQQSAYHHEMEYGNGSAIEGVGGLEVWREIYRDAFYMSQT